MNITKWPANSGRPGGIVEFPGVSNYSPFPGGSVGPDTTLYIVDDNGVLVVDDNGVQLVSDP